jgi:hypothetical protein
LAMRPNRNDNLINRIFYRHRVGRTKFRLVRGICGWFGPTFSPVSG